MATLQEKIKPYFNHRLLVTLVLGFASGLPFCLTHTTLQGWFAVNGVSIVTIGFLGLIGLPYTFKFLWAPLLDRFSPNFLGRRRGWILLAQVILIFLILSLCAFNPGQQAFQIGLVGLFISFFSATQDVVIDAYRAELLPSHERGLGAALGVTGYRIAMLLSGGIALIMADHIGWQLTVMVMAFFLGIGILASITGPEPAIQAKPPENLLAAIVEPIREFTARPNAMGLLFLVVLYKLSDAFAISLTTPFILQLGFNLTQIGMVTKVMGLLATLLGLFIGGITMTQLGLYRALLFFGILQGVSNFLFMLLAVVGKNLTLMATAIFLENLCSGMGTAAFVAFLMSLCNYRYTAVQFALLSALSAVGRELVSPVAGLMVESIGWVNFYLWTVLIAIPGLLLLSFLRQHIPEYEANINDQMAC